MMKYLKALRTKLQGKRELVLLVILLILIAVLLMVEIKLSKESDVPVNESSDA